MTFLKLLFHFSPSSEVGWNFPDQENDRMAELFHAIRKRKCGFEITTDRFAENQFFMSNEREEKTLDWREIGTKIPWKVRIIPRPVRPGFQGLYWTDIKLHTEFQRKWRWPRLLKHTPSNSLETNPLTIDSMMSISHAWLFWYSF